MAIFLHPVLSASRVQYISDMHSKFALKPHHVVMSCMRVCRKQALSRVKYYYYATISKIQQATIMTV